MELVDIGVNLTNKSLLRDLEAIMQRAGEAGVRQMVVTGTSVEESRQAIELCQRYPGRLVSTCGIHPHHACRQSWRIREHGAAGLRARNR
jgi:TatD DNase family protein